MHSPLVTVSMSVYNGEQYLRESIDSVLSQSINDLELVVINDGSTDSSGSILDSFQHRDSRVRVFHQQNKGLIESLNIGIGLARGKYIARMDADDISLNDRLALQVSFLEKEPKCAVVGGGIEIINASGVKIGACLFPAQHSVIRAQLMGGRCPISHPAVLMRKEALLSVGGYRKALIDAEDYDLWLRISDAFELANLETVILKYRRHPWQTSIQKRRQQLWSTLAAQASALARVDGTPDPLEAGIEITPAVLSTLGIDENRQRLFMIRQQLASIEDMCDAGESVEAGNMISSLQNSPEWTKPEPYFVVDSLLLSARVFWMRGHYRRSIEAILSACLKRPATAGRPVKKILRRLLGEVVQ